MKAAILESLDNLSVQDVPDPEIDDDAALMRVEAVSICGSDVRILHHGNPRVKPPTIIGHENSGVIVKTGKNVTRVKEGDRVSIGADVPCGQCHWCRNGLGNNCDINYAIGYQIPGAFAQYMKLPRLVLEEGPVTPFSETSVLMKPRSLNRLRVLSTGWNSSICRSEKVSLLSVSGR